MRSGLPWYVRHYRTGTVAGALASLALLAYAALG